MRFADRIVSVIVLFVQCRIYGALRFVIQVVDIFAAGDGGVEFGGIAVFSAAFASCRT